MINLKDGANIDNDEDVDEESMIDDECAKGLEKIRKRRLHEIRKSIRNSQDGS